MRKTIFRIALVTLLMFCLLGQVFAAGGRQQAAGELPVLRIALIPWLLSVPAVFVQEQGWDIENGFRIEISTYPMGAPVLEAMGPNLWDLCAIGTAAVHAMANMGLKCIAEISMASGGTGAFVRPNHPAAQIRGRVPGMPHVMGSADTLRGSRVLVPMGSLNHFNIQKLFNVHGLTHNDMQVIHMDNAASFQAFIVGEGDITAFSPPLSFRSRDEQGWVNLGGMTELNAVIWDHMYANPRLYDRNKDTIVKFIRQMYRANDILAADPALAADRLYAWQRFNGITSSLENARREVDFREIMTSSMARGRVPGESMRMVGEFFVTIGQMEAAAFLNFNNTTMVTEILELALGR